MTQRPAEQDSGGFRLRRLWPLAVLAAGFAAFFAFGLDEYLSFSILQQHREALVGWIDRYAVAAGLLFMAIYVAVVVFSVPGATVMTLAGGFLFGAVLGTGMVVLAATVGATLLFLAARTSLGDPLRARAAPWLGKMEAGFQRNALSYMLVLRLIPLFPFFVVNLVPAFLGVPTRIFFVATLFGIIPGTFVYATAGAGLGDILDRGEEFSFSGILTPKVIAALVGLAALALLPVIYKWWKGRRG